MADSSSLATDHRPLTIRASVRVVLVRPAFPGNIGSVARVMRNFGVADLRLVQPHSDHLSEEARQLSTHGEPLLHTARSVHDLAEAAADCGLVVATSARQGGLFRLQTVITPRALAPRLVEAAQRTSVALVFGPEQTGLTNAEVSRCHHLVTIPTSAEHPALNLAQSVAICLYELFQVAAPIPAKPQAVAEFAHQERMFESLRAALTDIHFLYGEKADSLMHALRHLIGRAQPSPMEVDVLIGLARQIQWYVKQRQPTSPECLLPLPASGRGPGGGVEVRQNPSPPAPLPEAERGEIEPLQ